MARMIKVGAIDDDRMMLQGTAKWFVDIGDIEMVQTAATVADYLKLDVAADVVLLDVNLRDGTRPADNVARLVRRGNKVLVISVIPDKEYILSTLEAGAQGYLTKSHNLAELARTIREIAAGSHLVSHEAAFAIGRDERVVRPKLSIQEQRTAVLYGRGMTLQAVAEEMNVSFNTAKSNLQRAKDKYREAGRPFHTKVELGQRLREDQLDPGPPV